MRITVLSPRAQEVALAALRAGAEAASLESEEGLLLCEAVAALPALVEERRALSNIAAIAHNAIVWYSGDRKRMFHRLGDLAEELCRLEGLEPADPAQTQLQMETVRIRQEWGRHQNG